MEKDTLLPAVLFEGESPLLKPTMLPLQDMKDNPIEPKTVQQAAIDLYFNEVERADKTMHAIQQAKRDDAFVLELRAIEEWVKVLSEIERTTAIYQLLQYITPQQIRFFITILNTMARKGHTEDLRTPVSPKADWSYGDKARKGLTTSSPAYTPSYMKMRPESTPPEGKNYTVNYRFSQSKTPGRSFTPQPRPFSPTPRFKKQTRPETPEWPRGDEKIDFALLDNVPLWFRSMRLHKYTPNFEKKQWREIVEMTDEELLDMGVLALGARTKFLKVFAQIKAEMDAKPIKITLEKAQ